METRLFYNQILCKFRVVTLVVGCAVSWIVQAETALPEPPAELSTSSYEISPAIVRASARYLNSLIAAEGKEVLLVFPGRSMTVMSILAEQRGMAVVNIPGSGLTESLDPAKWEDTTTRPKLELYRSLVQEQLNEARKAHPGKKIVMVDMADTGESIVRFQSMLNSILKEDGSSKKVESYFLRDFGMRSGVSKYLADQGVKEITIDVPQDTSGLKLTEEQSQAWLDRFYRHQPDAIAFAGTAGNVPQFDVMEVDPNDPKSVERYRSRFKGAGGSLNQTLRTYLRSVNDGMQSDPSMVSCESLFSNLQ